MTPADWFVLVLRAFGVWRFLNVIDNALAFFHYTVGTYRPDGFKPDAYITQGATDLFVAAVLLLFAPRICAVFYPVRRDSASLPLTGG